MLAKVASFCQVPRMTFAASSPPATSSKGFLNGGSPPDRLLTWWALPARVRTTPTATSFACSEVGEAFLGVGSFLAAPSYPGRLVSAPAALRCEAPFKVSALPILLWFAPSMVLQRTVLLPFPWSYNPFHPSTPSFLGSVAT
jgi:hypothetical protein